MRPTASFFCFKPVPGAHAVKECLSPAFQKEVNVTAPVIACEHAIADGTQPEGSPQMHISASVQAEPHKAVTMLFAATVQGPQAKVSVRVLLDTGSSRNVCSSAVMKLHKDATGKVYSVSTAGTKDVSKNATSC